MRARFADDHPIVMLRGATKLSHKDALRAFARRAAWLSNKIEKFPGRAFDPAASYLVQELAAVGVAVEAIEASIAAQQAVVPATEDQ